MEKKLIKEAREFSSLLDGMEYYKSQYKVLKSSFKAGDYSPFLSFILTSRNSCKVELVVHLEPTKENQRDRQLIINS